MMDRWQTTHTPNVLGIYLLMRVLKNSVYVGATHKRIEAQARAWISLFNNNLYFQLFTSHPSTHSYTVICLTGEANVLEDVKKRARKAGFILGEGYGELKKTSFRIANFPSITKDEIRLLRDFFKSYRYPK
jgi:phosphoserine aminotransferase